MTGKPSKHIQTVGDTLAGLAFDYAADDEIVEPLMEAMKILAKTRDALKEKGK